MATLPRETLGVVAGGQDQRPLPSPGFIRFRAVNNVTLGLVAELDGPVIPTDGYATHEVTMRPGREGIATFSGRNPMMLRIPLLLDRDTARGSVETELKMLERMHGLGGLPPLLIVEGVGVAHGAQRSPAFRWQLTGNPEYGDDIRHLPDGKRSRVPVVVTAIRIVKPSTLTQPNQGSLVAVREHYKVPKNGHPRSLKGIAKKYRTTVKALRALNPKVKADPDVGLKAGLKVRVY